MKKKCDKSTYVKLFKNTCFEPLFKNSTFLISTGKEFQRVGAATEKEQAPQAWV